jgi:hypothetical protein
MKKTSVLILLLAQLTFFLCGCDRNDVNDIASNAPKAVSVGLDILQQQADAVAPALQSLKQDQLDSLYKIEYLIKDFPADASASQLQSTLNALGNDGWECFSISRNESSSTTRYTFKKRAKSYLPLLLRLIH